MNLPYEKNVSVHPFPLWEISKFDNLSARKGKVIMWLIFLSKRLIHTDIKYRAKPKEALTDFVMGRQECLYTCN